ncbi:hypothetical protein ACLOJK_029128 [Asimina triloba]
MEMAVELPWQPTLLALLDHENRGRWVFSLVGDLPALWEMSRHGGAAARWLLLLEFQIRSSVMWIWFALEEEQSTDYFVIWAAELWGIRCGAGSI